MGTRRKYFFAASPTFLAALVLCSTRLANAQADPVIDYFPLQVGNSWTYFDTLSPPPDFRPDTTVSGGGTVLEQVVLDDTTYFRISGPIRGTNIRKDELGRIWVRRDTDLHSSLLYDFTLEDSAEVDMGPDHPIFPDTILKVRRGFTSETHVGTFENCIEFSFEHKAAIDADWGYTFAPDFGVIEYGGGPGFRGRILRATLNGVVVDDTEELPEIKSDFTLLGNYPNPFAYRTTISFVLASPSTVDILVYDVTGRLVRVSPENSLAVGSHRVVVEMLSLPPSVYFYSVRAGRRVARGKMVLLK